MTYEDPKSWLNQSKEVLDIVATGDVFHPDDRVKMLDTIATYATEKAAKVRETNDREGVPDRAEG